MKVWGLVVTSQVPSLGAKLDRKSPDRVMPWYNHHEVIIWLWLLYIIILYYDDKYVILLI